MRKCLFGLLWVAVLLSLVAACEFPGKRPTICDRVEGPSILCQVAEKNGVRLEDVGTGLILVNAVAISEGVYTKSDAKNVLGKILQALDGPVTYVFFKEHIIRSTEAFPGLLDVATVYLEEFSLSKKMHDADRDILRVWLTNRIKSL